MNETQQSWEKFLHPDSLKGNLISISLFISAFEMFRESIIEKPKTLFLDGFDENGLIISKKYKTDVLSKSKSPLYASLLWFKAMNAISDEDIKSFDAIREHRNEITHEMLSFLSDAKKNIDVEKFHALIEILSKIEKWWLINFEMEIDPGSANPDEVISGSILTLRLMLDIALGNEPEEGYYYNEFTKRNI